MTVRTRAVFTVLALLLAQPLVPVANAHSGHQEHEGGSEGGEAPSSSGPIFRPNASPVTPDIRYVRQENPAVHGDLVVWQQKRVGHDWDVMAINLSSDDNAVPVATRDAHETDPAVRGPWIAWEHHPKTKDSTTTIKILDTRTGTTIQVPDSGKQQFHPVFGDDELYYLEPAGEESKRRLFSFDLASRSVEEPIGNRTILTPPDTHGRWLTWAEGARGAANIVVYDTLNDTKRKLPQLWTVRDGPTIGPAGVAWVANHGGAQGGEYTVIWNETTEFDYRRSGVYPHRNIAQCEVGVVWDQPGTATGDFHGVALWDRFVEKRAVLTPNNTNPDCSSERLVYEKTIESEDDDLGHQPRIYADAMENLRRPTDATVRLDPGLEDAIFSGTVNLTGRAMPGDPREPITGVYGSIDNGPFYELETRTTEDGVRWRFPIDADDYLSGSHVFTVVVEDNAGSQTRENWKFYTDTPYRGSNAPANDLDVPRTDPSPFPFNLIDHYKAYQPFYNTVALGILLLAAAVYAVRRYREKQAIETPEYVPPEDT